MTYNTITYTLQVEDEMSSQFLNDIQDHILSADSRGQDKINALFTDYPQDHVLPAGGGTR
jgi:hypothetical protein